MPRRPRDEESDSSSASDEEAEEGSENSHSEDESADSNDPDLTALNKADLVALCRRLRLKTTGTKDQLIARVEKHRKSERKQEKVKISLHPDISCWKHLLKTYAGKVEWPLRFDWHSPRIVLCPPLWLVVFWSSPPSEVEIFEPLGSEGSLIRSLKARWKTLTSANDEQVQMLSNHFSNLYESVTAAHLRVSRTTSPDEVIETWLGRNWTLHVAPASQLCRMLQAEKARMVGLSTVADRLEARARLPLENFGADVVDMVERAIQKDTPQLQHRGGRGGGGRGSGGPGNPTFKCFKCKKMIAIPAGTDRKSAITAHRASCK